MPPRRGLAPRRSRYGARRPLVGRQTRPLFSCRVLTQRDLGLAPALLLDAVMRLADQVSAMAVNDQIRPAAIREANIAPQQRFPSRVMPRLDLRVRHNERLFVVGS